MPRLRASQLELALEVGQGHIHVAHGHTRIGVAKQFHDRGEADAGTKHFRPVGVAQLMRDDTGGQAGRVTGQVQIVAETREKRDSRSMPCEEPPIVGQRIEKAEEAQSMNEITDESINRNHTFGFELAQRYVDRPLVRTYGVQAVIREVDTLADAHAGVPEQEEDVSGKIVATHQLLLEEMILLCSEWTGQGMWRARNILAPYQVSEFSKLVGPGQFVQNGAQSDETSDAGCSSQRRSLCTHARHPSKGVRIAA